MNPIGVLPTWMARPTKRQLHQQLDSLRQQYRTLCHQIEDLRTWIVHIEGKKDALSARITGACAALEVVNDLLRIEDQRWTDLECTRDFLRHRVEATQVDVHMGRWLAENVRAMRQSLEATQDAVHRVEQALNPRTEQSETQSKR